MTVLKNITNGGKPSWLTWIITLGIILGVVLSVSKVTDRIFKKGGSSALMAQTIETNTDTIKEVETEVIDVKERFDKYLRSEERKALLDSVYNENIIEFVAQQVEFNGEVKEHMIKQGIDK